MGTVTTDQSRLRTGADLPARAPARPSRVVLIAVCLLTLLGTVLRLYRFPQVPVGLQQDEVSEAYEAYSLLHTGADRWGNRMPAYFLSWGSGQNVMQAYLTVPVIAITGLTRASTRIVPLVCGILTLPAIFWLTWLWYGEVAGLAALFILTLAPWHIFLSRFGIENNPLPFFLTTGLLTWTIAIRSRSPLKIALCLLPFAAAAYTYGVALPFLAVLIPLLALVSLRPIRQSPRPWIAALALFLVSTAPLDLFLAKNHLFRRDYSFEHSLPFTAPMLTVTRFDQIQSEAASGRQRLKHNLHLISNGLSSDIQLFQVPNRAPLPRLIYDLALVGLLAAAFLCWRRKRLDDPFLLWSIACLPIVLLIPLNTSRAIVLGIPYVIFAGSGFAFLLRLRPERVYKGAVVALAVVLFAIPVQRFLRAYFGEAYAAELAPYTYPDLPQALGIVTQQQRPGELVYISNDLALNYVQVLFFLKIDPHTFQAAHPTVDNPDFGPFRFTRERIAASRQPFVYLLSPGEADLCAASTRQQAVGPFRLGHCPAPTAN